jgi:uncharacterized membrane protein
MTFIPTEISTRLYHLVRLSRRIWVRVTMMAALAVVTAALSPWIGPLLPDRLAAGIDSDQLHALLSILSASMLAVTTFGVTVVATAMLTAAGQMTPRVHRVLREDATTQTVLATFVGAFVYALASIVMIDLGLHGRDSYGTVYLATVGVIGLVILAILGWIEGLITLGAMDRTISSVAERTAQSIDAWREAPFLGGVAAEGPLPRDAWPLNAAEYGYVRHIDLTALRKAAGSRAGVRLAVRHGDWADRGMPLAHLWGTVECCDRAELAKCFVVGSARPWEADPAHGLIVMSEIASRALSPGINDPRTAEDVLARLTPLLADLVPVEPAEVTFDWLEVPALRVEKMLALAVDPIARDGRAYVEVHLRLQAMLAHLVERPDAKLSQAAREAADRALAYAREGLLLAWEIERVEEGRRRLEPVQDG